MRFIIETMKVFSETGISSEVLPKESKTNSELLFHLEQHKVVLSTQKKQLLTKYLTRMEHYVRMDSPFRKAESAKYYLKHEEKTRKISLEGQGKPWILLAKNSL
jgi:hypothetical protein